MQEWRGGGLLCTSYLLTAGCKKLKIPAKYTLGVSVADAIHTGATAKRRLVNVISRNILWNQHHHNIGTITI